MATEAFIAHDGADEAAAMEIAADLERNGWTVARSGPELRQGSEAAALVQKIGESGFVVILASAEAHSSVWLQREAAAALSNGRPIAVAQTGEWPAESWVRASLDVSHLIDLRGGVGPEQLGKINDAARGVAARGRVIAMLNIKGGVGKTVLSANLFAAAHLADKRSISFIDLDPQHNLSQYFLPPGERNRIRDQGATIYSVLTDARPIADFPAMATSLNRAKSAKDTRFDLICGDERLFEFTLDTRPEREKATAFLRFRALIAALRERSDAVIIDANPCATFLTRLAITSADHIVAPVRPEKYSLTGLNMLEHVVREVRGRPLRSEEFSVLLNGVNDRTRAPDNDADQLTRAEISAAPFFGAALLPEAVPYASVLRSAPTDRIVTNPVNVTAMMRVGGRGTKEALAQAAAAVLKRAGA